MIQHLDYLLWFLLINLLLIAILFIRHSQSREIAMDAEMLMPKSSPLEKGPQDTSASSTPSIPVETRQIEDSDFVKSFLHDPHISGGAVTSGFLAAKADADLPDTTSGFCEEPSDLEIPSNADLVRTSPTLPKGFFDDDVASWKRHTYCSGQKSTSRLAEDSCHDQTEYLPDDSDLAIIWRRRTMVFGSNP